MNINKVITNQPLPSANLNTNTTPQHLQPPVPQTNTASEVGFLLQPNQSSSNINDNNTTEEKVPEEETKTKKDDVRTTKTFCGITISDSEDDCACCCFLCRLLRRPISDYVGGCVGDYFKGNAGESCCSGLKDSSCCKDGCCEGGCTGCCDGCTDCCDGCIFCSYCEDGCYYCCNEQCCNEESCGSFGQCVEVCCTGCIVGCTGSNE